MEAKYQLFGNPVIVEGRKGRIHELRHVKALTRFKTATGHEVQPGDIGGYIESEDNLSQTGGAWVDQWAQVYGEAKVYGDAYVGGSSQVYDQAKVGDEVQLLDITRVCGTSVLAGHTTAYGVNEISGKSFIRNCDLIGKARLVNVQVDGNWARITDSFVKNVIIRDNGRIIFSTVVGGRNRKGASQLTVKGDAMVCGCNLEGRFTISGNAMVEGCQLKCLDWRHPCTIAGAAGIKNYVSDCFRSPIPVPDWLCTRELVETIEEYLPSDTYLPHYCEGLVSYDRETETYFLRELDCMKTKALLDWAHENGSRHHGLVESVKAIIAYFQGECK